MAGPTTSAETQNPASRPVAAEPDLHHAGCARPGTCRDGLPDRDATPGALADLQRAGFLRRHRALRGRAGYHRSGEESETARDDANTEGGSHAGACR